MDDTSTCLHPADIIPFLQHFHTLGAPLGLHLNLAKTKLLTTTSGVSVRDQPTTPHTTALIQALDYIQQQDPNNPDPELTTGTRYLGQPLGSTAFATAFLNTASHAYATNIHKLCTKLSDKHTMFLLFKSCAQPSLQHLLTSDIYYHCNPDMQEPLSQWTSPLCESISQTNTDFLAHLGDTTTLPETAQRIAHHPIKLGGLGVRDHPLAAKTAYVISLTRSLRYAAPTQHTETRTPTPRLSPAHARLLNSHAHPQSTHRLFRLYHALAPQVIHTLNAAKLTNPPITSPQQLINDCWL
jgi:hypothetical protein